MSFWRSFSVTGLAVVTGTFFQGAALAGDKIEFSISGITTDKIEFSKPAAPIDPPPVVQDDKDLPKTEYSTSDTANRLFLEDNIQAESGSPDVVIITSPKPKKERAWDAQPSDSEDNGKSDLDAYDSYDNSDPRQTPSTAGTNAWDATKLWNRGTETRGLDETTTDDRNRFDPMASVRTDKQKDQPDDWRAPKSSRDSGWTLSYLHPGGPGFGPANDNPYHPSYSALLMAAEQPAKVVPSVTISAPTETAPSRGLFEAPTTANYNSNARRNDEGTTPQLNSSYHYSYDYSKSSYDYKYKDPFLQHDLGGPLPGQSEPPPAILRFPKKPGDVLK